MATSSQKIPTVAIVGRPNVGKSTLFNRMVGHKVALTSPIPGTTRDWLAAPIHFKNKLFQLVDTGGIITGAKNIEKLVTDQAKNAAASADLILFLADYQTGPTNLDREVLNILLKYKKPIILVINKVDSVTPDLDASWYTLGIKKIIMVSALNGRGVLDLTEEISQICNKTKQATLPENLLKIAIIGRPNVGKSSLINKISGIPRLLTHPVAGTTRDSIDVLVSRQGKDYIIIDTAGVRKRKNIFESLEIQSVQQARKTIERSDLIVILIDYEERIKSQDINLIKAAEAAGKGMILALSKWDLQKGKDKNKIMKMIYFDLPDFGWLPIIFTSAVTDEGVSDLFSWAEKISAGATALPATKKLNNIISQGYHRFPGLRGKIYFTRIAKKRPLVFEVFVSNPKLFPKNFSKFLARLIRKNINLEGLPFRIILKKSA